MTDAETYQKDREWAMNLFGVNDMTLMEQIFASGQAGLDHPYKMTAEYQVLAHHGMVEPVDAGRGVKAIRFTSTGAKFVLRYLPEAQKRGDRWWVLMPADKISRAQRDIVVAWESLLSFMAKLDFMGPAEQRAFLETVKGIDEEHREHTLAFVRAVFAVYDKEA